MQIMHTMQKFEMAGIEDVMPVKKANAFVTDVIVIEGPAWYIAC